MFGSVEELGEYSKSISDLETLSCLGVVKLYGSRLPAIVDRVRNSVVVDAKKADVILTTGHRSKGLEWPVCALASDFISAFDEDGLPTAYDEKDDEDWNNLYVGLTRAKLKILPPESLKKLVAYKKDLDFTGKRNSG